MKNKDLTEALKRVLFNYWNRGLFEKANFIISLCGFYGTEAMSEAVQTELTKLTSQLPMLRMFESLLEALEKGRSNDFRWEPHFHPEHVPTHLTMSPTFNVQKGDESTIVAEIEKLRNELQRQSVNIDLLISHIATKARESGDLNFEENS